MESHELTGKLMFLMQLHHRVVDKTLHETGLHHAQHRLLLSVAKGDASSQVELAKMLRVTPATITISIKNLERDGYLIRKMNARDNRYNDIELTEKGKDVVERSHLVFDRIDEILFENVTQEEREKLAGLLDKLTNNLKTEYEKISQGGKK